MSGPYIDGLGKRRRDEEKTSSPSNDEENNNFFFETQNVILRSTKRLRVTPTDAQVMPKFRPEDKSSNVTGWLHKIDQLGDIYGWNSKDRQFIMQIRLRGSAREWYDDLEDYDLTWEEWKEALQTAFPRSTDYVNRLEEMLARTKTDSESMTKYYHAKLSLLKKCNIDGEAAISCIIRGLPLELRTNAKAYQCDKPENLYFGYLSSLDNYKHVEAANTIRRTTWRRGSYINNNFANTTSMNATASTSKQLPHQVCYVCQRPGHEARDCAANPLRCEVCQRVGHGALDCWFAASSSRQQQNKIDGATDEKDTFKSALERSIQCATAFTNLGLQYQDVIVIMAPNHINLVIPMYAALFLGIRVAGVDMTLGAEALSDTKQLRGGVIFVKELPLTHTFKIDRPKLAKLAQTMKQE